MAVSTKKQEEPAASELQTIEQLREHYQTDAATYAGTAAMYGWCKGKEIDAAEYAKAVSQFKAAAAGRRT